MNTYYHFVSDKREFPWQGLFVCFPGGEMCHTYSDNIPSGYPDGWFRTTKPEGIGKDTRTVKISRCKAKKLLRAWNPKMVLP